MIDQCMYGLLITGQSEGELMAAKKPTRFASNSWFILEELQIRCDGGHVHQPLVGGRAAKAAEYPDDLCEAFGRGLAGQIAYDRSHRVCTGVLSAPALRSLFSVVSDVCAEETALLNPVGGLSMPGTVPPSGKPESWSKPCYNNQFPCH